MTVDTLGAMPGTTPTVDPDAQQRTLVRLMLLSVAAAVVTIALKVAAAALTGSVGFLSDAMESMVNLVAALVGLCVLLTGACALWLRRLPAPAGGAAD